MKTRRLLFNLLFTMSGLFAFLATVSVSAAASRQGSDCNTNAFIPMSASSMRALDEAMRNIRPSETKPTKDDPVAVIQGPGAEAFESGSPEQFAMQIGLGGNPDVDNGKPFREKSWVVSVLYPVKTTRVGKVPTTIYVEARCASLGKQPASAYTDNINVRCGPGIIADAKMAEWLSTYARVGLVTSRFSHNGAPRGQINPKTNREFRLYPNDTWFTGAAIGAGVKIKILKDTQLFGEYTKYYVQQTDNPAYQFRGGYTAGISRKFWLFQK
jgi:hypothetical protein